MSTPSSHLESSVPSLAELLASYRATHGQHPVPQNAMRKDSNVTMDSSTHTTTSYSAADESNGRTSRVATASSFVASPIKRHLTVHDLASSSTPIRKSPFRRSVTSPSPSARRNASLPTSPPAPASAFIDHFKPINPVASNHQQQHNVTTRATDDRESYLLQIQQRLSSESQKFEKYREEEIQRLQAVARLNDLDHETRIRENQAQYEAQSRRLEHDVTQMKHALEEEYRQREKTLYHDLKRIEEEVRMKEGQVEEAFRKKYNEEKEGIVAEMAEQYGTKEKQLRASYQQQLLTLKQERDSFFHQHFTQSEEKQLETQNEMSRLTLTLASSAERIQQLMKELKETKEENGGLREEMMKKQHTNSTDNNDIHSLLHHYKSLQLESLSEQTLLRQDNAELREQLQRVSSELAVEKMRNSQRHHRDTTAATTAFNLGTNASSPSASASICADPSHHSLLSTLDYTITRQHYFESENERLKLESRRLISEMERMEKIVYGHHAHQRAATAGTKEEAPPASSSMSVRKTNGVNLKEKRKAAASKASPATSISQVPHLINDRAMHRDELNDWR